MAMHRTQDPGRVSPRDGAQGVNKLSEPEHIESGNAGTRYRRLLHRHCTSLDLERAFKQIKISQDIKPELCTQCHTEKCRCPAFTPGTPAPLHHPRLRKLMVTTRTFPSWWMTNRYTYYIHQIKCLLMRKLIEK